MKYIWICYSCPLINGVTNTIEKSEKKFDSKKDAYNDMRNAALKRMQFNSSSVKFNDSNSNKIEINFVDDKIIAKFNALCYNYSIKECDTFKVEFWNYWDELISILDQEDYKTICLGLWVTDVMDDREKWVEYFSKYFSETDIAKLPISLDIMLKTPIHNDDKNSQLASQILGEIYDATYWRIDQIPNTREGILKLAEKLKRVDEMLAKNELENDLDKIENEFKYKLSQLLFETRKYNLMNGVVGKLDIRLELRPRCYNKEVIETKIFAHVEECWHFVDVNLCSDYEELVFDIYCNGETEAYYVGESLTFVYNENGKFVIR